VRDMESILRACEGYGKDTEMERKLGIWDWEKDIRI
jgi:hypothetical protein